MNIEKLTYLLQNPTNIDALKTQQLDEILNEYPYFQSARAIHLKGLNKINSFKYNQALKKTAAFTIDRKVLFEFITSQNFSMNSKIENIAEIEINKPLSKEVIEKNVVTTVSDQADKTTEASIELTKVKKEYKEYKEQGAEILEIGKPIQFNATEPHSFNEWMQLISQKPIERDKKPEKPTKTEEKFQLIDKFIESKPKIKPADKTAVNQNITPRTESNSDSLMTETLAKVYLEQHKYESAIKAYHILSLKYPEKSGFFADRIKAIKNLQINKS